VDGNELVGGAAAGGISGNYCRPDASRLSRPFDAEPPTALTAFVHDSFRALVLNDRFACVGGGAAVRRNTYRFGLYEVMGSPASSTQLACDLGRFIGDEELAGEPLTAFVASFVGPVPGDEETFEDLLWRTLQQLADRDAAPWAVGRQSDPDAPTFTFSFGGTSFFVVGLHAASSRLTRRFAWPTLMFNPHDQFDRLRHEGTYDRMRTLIRERDRSLQGSVNPMLTDFGQASEARQYSGRQVGEDWKCPFHPSPGLTSERNGK
jgi:FPC/CPF motif-containing protein YcgG